nr:MAG TPA: hypothetical protein [Caudoviricetes sp.]
MSTRFFTKVVNLCSSLMNFSRSYLEGETISRSITYLISIGTLYTSVPLGPNSFRNSR